MERRSRRDRARAPSGRLPPGSRSAGSERVDGRSCPRGAVRSRRARGRAAAAGPGRGGPAARGVEVTRTAMPSGGRSEVGRRDVDRRVGDHEAERDHALARERLHERARRGRLVVVERSERDPRRAAPSRTAGRRETPGPAPSSFAATSVRGTAERRGTGPSAGSACAGSGRGPRPRSRRGSATEVAGIAVPGIPHRTRSKRFRDVGICFRTPRARSRGLVGLTPTGTVVGITPRPSMPWQRRAQRPVVDRAREPRSRTSPASPGLRPPPGPASSSRSRPRSPPPANPPSSKRIADSLAARNASTTSTIGHNVSSPSDANGIIAVPPIPVAIDLEEVLRRRRAVRGRHEAERLLLEVARRRLEEPRRDALPVAALSVARRAVADVRLVSREAERIGGRGLGVLATALIVSAA